MLGWASPPQLASTPERKTGSQRVARRGLTCSSCSTAFVCWLSSCCCSEALDSRSHSFFCRAAGPPASRLAVLLSPSTWELSAATRWPRPSLSDSFRWGGEGRREQESGHSHTPSLEETSGSRPLLEPGLRSTGLAGRAHANHPLLGGPSPLCPAGPCLQALPQAAQLELQAGVLLRHFLTEALLKGRLPQRLGQLQVKPARKHGFWGAGGAQPPLPGATVWLLR